MLHWETFSIYMDTSKMTEFNPSCGHANMYLILENGPYTCMSHHEILTRIICSKYPLNA